MMLPPITHSIAVLAFERLLYSLAAGTALVLVIAATVRLLPLRNSHTRFAIWFSVLLAVIALPFFAEAPAHRIATATLGPMHALITISSSWAEYIVLAWALLAALGLTRMGFGLWQLRRLRQSCSPVDLGRLGPLTSDLLIKLQGFRRVALLSSPRIEIPAAIGFLHPVIVLPAWMVANGSKADLAVCDESLKYILLHELAHLTRWDDWTNVAQKLIKAILFFHPGVWWIDRNLALDREMACDEAVIAQTGNPREYAQCLTGVAEKSFLRRQIALAQAAVSRVRQLSVRIARIMENPGSRSTRIWKPAVPIVMAVAVLCAVSTSNTTQLVAVGDRHPADASARSQIARAPLSGGDQVINITPLPRALKIDAADVENRTRARLSPANLKSRRPAGLSAARYASRAVELHNISEPSRISHAVEAALESREKPVQPQDQKPSQLVVLVVSSRRVIENGSSNWHVSTVQLFFYVPVSMAKQNPHKI